jgi:hypothetical protein
MKDPIKVNIGRNARARGAEFELKVRKDLEEKGWIVDKWSNNLFPLNNQPFSIECKLKIGPAKHKFGLNGPLALGTGFCDFVCFKQIKELEGKTFRKILIDEVKNREPILYEVIGVESKVNGILSAIEKEKCRWYLKNNIFSKILIAEKTKVKNKVVIVYHDFEEKYGR